MEAGPYDAAVRGEDGGDQGRPTVGALAVPVVLAVVAGFVDAVAFLHLVGVFPANQSGNAVLFGIGVGGASPSPVWATGGAMVGFAVGVVGGRGWSARRPSAPHRTALLAVELTLLALVAAVAVALDHDGSALLPDGWRAVVVVVASLAMGVQTEVLRRGAGVAVATTYQTGAITRMGEAIGTLPGTRERAEAQHVVAVLGSVLAGYVAGAALGATPLGDGPFGLVPAVLALVVVLVVDRTRGGGLGRGPVHDGSAP